MVIFHSYVKLPEGTLYIEDIGIHLFGLVGGFNPFEKYEFVSWDDDIPNIWKYKSCSKPPTRMGLGFNLSIKLNLVTNWGYHIWHIERETNLI